VVETEIAQPESNEEQQSNEKKGKEDYEQTGRYPVFFSLSF